MRSEEPRAASPAVLTPGYAPLEQYSGEGIQGPWTDLYAFAGVLYRAVTNHAPPDAVTRLRADSVSGGLAAARGRYSEPFLRAIEWALTMDEKRRPQSVDEWQRALFDTKAAAPAAVASAPTYESTLVLTPQKPRRWPWVAVAAVLIISIAVIGVLNKQRADVPSQENIKQQLRRDFEAQFRSADANADGYLSPGEVRGRFPGIAREFARADGDNDGRISMREFLRVRRMQLERKLAK